LAGVLVPREPNSAGCWRVAGRATCRLAGDLAEMLTGHFVGEHGRRGLPFAPLKRFTQGEE